MPPLEILPFAHACKLGPEGIVSKHRGHPYRSGPCKSWIKVENHAALDRSIGEASSREALRKAWSFTVRRLNRGRL
jgi:ATP-dependent DNA ligase